MSNFQKVVEFSKQFGIKVSDKPDIKIFSENPKLIEYRMSLIREEIRELCEGVSKQNYVEVIDALGDILYVVYGMGSTIGADLDDSFLTVYNNKSKISNFRKVMEYRGTKLAEVNPDIFLTCPKLIENNITIIMTILNNLEYSVKMGDYNRVVYDLTTLIFNIYDVGILIAIDLDKVFDIVHDSNMTKMCKTRDEAQKTVKYYLDNKNDLGYDTPAYRLSDNKKYFVVYNKSTMKILKSINYTPADFTKLIMKQTS